MLNFNRSRGAFWTAAEPNSFEIFPSFHFRAGFGRVEAADNRDLIKADGGEGQGDGRGKARFVRRGKVAVEQAKVRIELGRASAERLHQGVQVGRAFEADEKRFRKDRREEDARRAQSNRFGLNRGRELRSRVS